LPFRDACRQKGRRKRTLDIAEAMLPKLRDLDPGKRAERPADVGQLDPGQLRISLASEAAEQPRSLPEEPAFRPWRVPPEWIGGRPRIRDRIPPWPAAVVGPSAR
jgi:hypothetical protein